MRKTKNAEQIETPELPTEGKELFAKIATEKACFIKVIGDGVFGLSDGDFLIVEETNTLHENALSAFLVPDSEHYEMGYGYDNFGDLAYFDGAETQRFKKGKAQIVGVVIGVVKPIGRQFYAPTESESKELTFTCDECKKTIFGTREFVESLGWKLQDEHLCLNCDLKNE